MNRRRKHILAALVLFVVLALCAIFVPSGPPDPMYEGNHLSYWLRQPPKFTNIFSQWAAFIPALDPIDTNAIPMLVYELDRVHNPFRRAYSATWHNSPRWLQVTLPELEDTTQVRRTAMKLLLDPKLESPVLVPTLVRSLERDDDASVRANAAILLGRRRKSDPSVIRALRHGLHDQDSFVRLTSTNALRQLNPNALTNAATK